MKAYTPAPLRRKFPFDITVTISPAARPGEFAVYTGGRQLLAGSQQPLLDSARALLAEGHAVDAVLVMRHRGSSIDALRSTIGVAAALTVTDSRHGTPTFRAFRRGPAGVVAAPPMRKTGEGVH